MRKDSSTAAPAVSTPVLGLHRTTRLEDGERVIRLRRGRRGKHQGWRSDLPHAGRWSATQDYVLVPCRYPGRRARRVLRRFSGLVDRSSDAEVLLLGRPDVVFALISTGPAWCRAQKRSVLSPERRAALRVAGAQNAFGQLGTTISPEADRG